MAEKEFEIFKQNASRTYIADAPGIYEDLFSASRVDIPVLILGETGTGKELIASIIHKNSPRATKPFIPVNCAMLPKDLIYAELFGHEKGAFTGANQSRKGRFLEAEGGTIFLDEIGDLPQDVQIGLLRVLESGEICPLGTNKLIIANARIIAATNKPIWNDDRFRADLYHRLKVYPIFAPTLHEMYFIIPLLLRRFLIPTGVEEIDFHLLAFCIQNSWRGNVREFKNFCSYVHAKAHKSFVSLFDDRLYEFYNEEFTHMAHSSKYCGKDILLSAVLGCEADDIEVSNIVPRKTNSRLVDYYIFIHDLFTNKDEQQLIKESGAVVGKNEWGDKKYIFPNLRLSAFPDSYYNYSKSIGNMINGKGLAKYPIGKIMLLLWRYRMNQQICQKIMAKKEDDEIPLDVRKYDVAKTDFERRYFTNVFRQHRDKTNHAIAKIIGKSDKTVKERRKEYGSE